MLTIYLFLFVNNLLVLSTSVHTSTIVIQVTGDCKSLGHQIAQNHGYRFVRQVKKNMPIWTIDYCFHLDFQWIL